MLTKLLRILVKANIKRLLERLLLFDNGQGKRVRGNSWPGESVHQCFAKKNPCSQLSDQRRP